MKLFARNNLSAAALRRGILVSSLARCGGANQKCVQRLKRLKIEVIFIKEVK